VLYESTEHTYDHIEVGADLMYDMDG